MRNIVTFLACCLALSASTLAQSVAPNCSFEPWYGTGGSATLTVCSSSSLPGCLAGSVLPTASAAAGLSMIGFGVPYACSTSKVEYIVNTADVSITPVHHYALGLVCQSGDCVPGALYVQTGSLPSGTGRQSFTPSGLKLVTKSWLPATGCHTVPCVLPTGIYGLVVASDCTSACAVLFGDGDTGTFYAFNARNAALNSPWIFDPVAGLPQTFSNMPAVQPTTLSGGTNVSRPPTVLIY
jgi:hypothetical protein